MSTPRLRLYHAAPSRSSTVLWMLEELGQPYELHVLDLKKGEQRQPAYLGVNPMGKVPALEHDGVLVTEVGAICLYLADAYPSAGLAPAIGDPLRGPYVRWMFFQGNCLEPALVDKALKREPGQASMMPYGDLDTTVETVAKAVAKRPWFLGDRFTALDVYFGSAIRWTVQFGLLPPRPELTSYVARLATRPALQRAEAKDKEIQALQCA
ncbi:MAG: glutathione S-transferase [Hyphomicrobiaceae bacterium]|nr:glutathione S-transferase [Hyphomicrobiaceae bacterium]